MNHPDIWNGKTLILFDELISNVKNGYVPDDFKFALYENNSTGEIVEIPYYGAWFMVNNRYLS